ADPFSLVLWEDDPACAIMSILDLNECRWRINDMASGLARGKELFGSKDTSCADFGELHSRIRSRPAGLVPDRVALAAHNDVVPWPGEHAEGDLIRHRTCRQPKRRLLS